MPAHTALNNYLRAGFGLGFKKDRVHVNCWLYAGGSGLKGLGAPDLAAVYGDSSVIRHVLWLEGAYRETPSGRDPAQTCYQKGFANI
jgi:hypothetical protein